MYTKGERPVGGAGEAAFWLPLLALFTGARLEELGQARTEDVKDIDGVPVLEISDRGEGMSVKTESSRRRIPIHQTLLDLAFLEYVETLRGAKDERLFPGLKPNKYGRWTPAWSKWWGRYARRKASIVDPRKVFHSFRHTFKDACRACHIPEEVHDALTGHSGSSVGRSYGGLHYPLAPLVEAMKKLRYPGLSLVHLKKHRIAL